MPRRAASAPRALHRRHGSEEPQFLQRSDKADRLRGSGGDNPEPLSRRQGERSRRRSTRCADRRDLAHRSASAHPRPAAGLARDREEKLDRLAASRQRRYRGDAPRCGSRAVTPSGRTHALPPRDVLWFSGGDWRGGHQVRRIGKVFLGAAAALVAASVSASAQYDKAYYDDMACRQYADQAVQPMRDQAGAQTAGSALVGAGLGAALGAAVGGGRGAAIGAGTGAIAGTGAGVANAQNAGAYIQQQYNAYYYQCMQQRSGPPPGYSPQPGYAPQPAYGSPPPGYY